MVDIFMGVGSFKLMLDAAKNLKNISDPDIRNDALVALQEQIVAAQESYSALLESVRTLEAEARNLETWESETRRVYRKLFRLSPATMADSSCMAKYVSSTSAGGMLPMGSMSRRLLNQSTHSSVANSTASKCARDRGDE